MTDTEMFTAQASEAITVQDVGSSVVVLALGSKVAEYLYWGAVSDKDFMLHQAKKHAAELRARYVQLAMEGAIADA